MNRGVNMSNMDEWFYEMVKKGLVCQSSTWIEQAVRQKNAKMTLALAHSKVLVYNHLHRVLVPREILN